MDPVIKEKFIRLWEKYFGNAELPLAFYYSNFGQNKERIPHSKKYKCIICDLQDVRKGNTFCLDLYRRGCHHDRNMTEEIIRDDTGKKGADEPYGQHPGASKKMPGIAREILENAPAYKAITRYIIFKRWDQLQEEDEPEIVIFFATPDVLSGLLTLAHFNTPEPHIAIAPSTTGCSSIISYPYLQRNAEVPLPIIGMFDHTARSCVRRNILTFSIPYKKFVSMINNMEQSFLVNKTWETIKKRIAK